MRLFARVPPHVNDEHVLSFEGFFVPGTLLPAADEALLVRVDVIVVDVLDQVVLSGKLLVAVPPVAVGLDKIARLVFHWIAGAVVVHGLASREHGAPVLVFVGRRRIAAHRLFLDLGAHFGHFHADLVVHRAGHGVGRLFLGRFKLQFSMMNLSIL